MIPTEIVLSPQSYAEIVSELAGSLGYEGVSHLQLAHHLALTISIQHENTDLIVLKELTPNPCPVCHRRLSFLRETIYRFESDNSNQIRCAMGHRYPGELKVYYLNIFPDSMTGEIEKPVKVCPECSGEHIQYLGADAMFCLDCDWDSGMEARYQIRGNRS